MNSEKKILLTIDDNKEIRDLVNVTLRSSEFKVFEAPDGREGIQLAKEVKPDVILLDIMMPGFDGFMTCKVLKRNLATKDIPVIFLTAKKSKEDINSALKAGGSDYIVKPFSPSDLLTRLRKNVESKRINQACKTKKEKEDSPPEKHSAEVQDSKFQELIIKRFTQYRDVIVCSDILSSIVMDNWHIYRNVFKNIVSDGIFKVVYDASTIKKIDGAGLGLLISVNESLRNCGGGLRIISQSSEVNNKFSYIKINDLFQGYNTIQEAIDSFQKIVTSSDQSSDTDKLNICMSCTYVNDPDSRFCKFCGSNLVIGRGEKIYEIIKHVISHNIISEAQTRNVSKINKNRNIKAEEYEIPSEFNVELFEENFVLKYKSVRTVRKYFKISKRIGIQAPSLRGKIIQLPPGMKLQLSGTQTGVFSSYGTEIKSVDRENGIIFVHYTEDAKVIHSQKNFSVAPSSPIYINLLNPSFSYSGEIMKGKILELSRLKMIVFTEDYIPENECLSVNFNLPTGHEISSPFVVAKNRREKFMYDIEFIVIDEKESSIITQYMYRRQIEIAKGIIT